MKNTPSFVLAVSIFIFLACSQETPPPDMKPISAARQGLISDTTSAFCICDNSSLWDIVDGRLSRKDSLDIGEKLTLLDQRTKAVFAGREREIQKVRLSSGKDGWIRSEFIAPDSILAVVVTDLAIVYSSPDRRAATMRTFPRMTILAIQRSSAAMDFVRVSSYDQQSETRYSAVFLRNQGISSWIGNVESAILYQVASRTENARRRAALLTSALADYPDSAFAALIQEALSAMGEP